MKWNKHIDSISLKATWTLNFIRRNVYKCSSETSQSLNRVSWGLICSMWPQHGIRTHIQISQKLKQFNPGQPGLIKTTIDKPHQFHLCWASWSGCHRLIDDDLHGSAFFTNPSTATNSFSLPTKQLQQHDRNTRSSDDLTIVTIPARTDSYEYYFVPRKLGDWNSLPLFHDRVVRKEAACIF